MILWRPGGLWVEELRQTTLKLTYLPERQTPVIEQTPWMAGSRCWVRLSQKHKDPDHTKPVREDWIFNNYERWGCVGSSNPNQTRKFPIRRVPYRVSRHYWYHQAPLYTFMKTTIMMMFSCGIRNSVMNRSIYSWTWFDIFTQPLTGRVMKGSKFVSLVAHLLKKHGSHLAEDETQVKVKSSKTDFVTARAF